MTTMTVGLRSIQGTDACVGWEDTQALIDTLADAVRQRRAKAAANGDSE